MKKTIKNFILLFSAMSIFIFGSQKVFAETITKIPSNYNINKIVPYTKVKNSIECNYTIDKTCPWNLNTKVKEIIPVYDFDNKVTGYIMNLSTKNKKTGYLRYDIIENNPELIEYGYDNDYSIKGKNISKHSISENHKLISLGITNFFIKEKNQVYSFDNHKNITKKVPELKKQHKKLETFKKNSRSIPTTRKQTVYSSVCVKNLWDNGYYPETMDTFSEGGVCATTCGVNLLKYWHVCRNIPSLYNSSDHSLKQTFGRLRKTMATSTSSGTNFRDGYEGIQKYCSEYACTKPKGRDYVDGFDWSWIKRNISNGNPFCMNAECHGFEGDTRYGLHSFLGVGYQETSDGNYIRVGNQWDHTFSHFYTTRRGDERILALWYYRW